jgi:Tfp pilus assembly protein PilF
MKQRTGFLFILFFSCVLAGCATGGAASKEQAEALRSLGEAYLGQQSYSMALTQFIKAEALDDSDYILQRDLGLAYMAKGDQETAVKHLKRALEIKPDYAEARNTLGVVYLGLEEWDLAIENFQKLSADLLYATPHYPLANLGKAYFGKKAYDQAEKYYKEALKSKPGFVNALYGLGKTYLAKGELSQAAEYYEKAVAEAPELAEVHFDLARTYRLLGEESKAKSEYETVVNLAPDSDMAVESKQELYRNN